MKQFGFSFLSAVLIVGLTVPPVAAAATKVPIPTASVTIAPAQDAEQATAVDAAQKSDYQLPYPGILPDHPLYFLKNLRDSIIEMLIADPVRKAEFFLLSADKGLNAGIFLYEKGQKDLAYTTIGIGEQRMKQSIEGLKTVKAGGRQIPGSTMDKLTKSLEKHIEVLQDFVGKTDGTLNSSFLNLVNQTKALQADAMKLK